MRSVSGPALYRKKPPKIYVHLMLRFVTTELRDRRPIARGVMRCSLSLAKCVSSSLNPDPVWVCKSHRLRLARGARRLTRARRKASPARTIRRDPCAPR